MFGNYAVLLFVAVFAGAGFDDAVPPVFVAFGFLIEEVLGSLGFADLSTVSCSFCMT